MPYHHTQRAILVVAVCLASAVFAAATVWQSGQWPAGIVPIALIAAALVFSSLTVEVNGKELRWYFGPGFWTYRLSRDEIQSVAVVRNHWWNGFGIRMRPGFRLYNVSGRGGRAANERRFRLRKIRGAGSFCRQGNKLYASHSFA